jgi:hypothetical protein
MHKPLAVPGGVTGSMFLQETDRQTDGWPCWEGGCVCAEPSLCFELFPHGPPPALQNCGELAGSSAT